MVNNHGDPKSPKDWVVGPLPNGHSWLINGVTNPLTNWDDPPSRPPDPNHQQFMVWEFLNHLGMPGDAWGMRNRGMLGFS